jgi:GNAT superfamily N-acetyltransferase
MHPWVCLLFAMEHMAPCSTCHPTVARAYGIMSLTPQIRALEPVDRADWEILARGYKAFYATPTSDGEYATAWERLLARDGVHALGAFVDGRLVGIAHYLFHTSTWARSNCYLQDLFTSPGARGRGVARSLIEAVAAQARVHGAARYYWLTQDDNAVARRLYDKVASHAGFIRYDFALRQPGA